MYGCCVPAASPSWVVVSGWAAQRCRPRLSMAGAPGGNMLHRSCCRLSDLVAGYMHRLHNNPLTKHEPENTGLRIHSPGIYMPEVKHVSAIFRGCAHARTQASIVKACSCIFVYMIGVGARKHVSCSSSQVLVQMGTCLLMCACSSYLHVCRDKRPCDRACAHACAAGIR